MNQTSSNNSEKKGFFNRLKRGLSKTREILTTDIDELFTGNRKLDDELLEELEELLITSDIGVSTAMDIMDTISKGASEIKNAHDLKQVLKDIIGGIIGQTTPIPETTPEKPHIVMVVGVNGVGKTTTIGKLANQFKNQETLSPSIAGLVTSFFNGAKLQNKNKKPQQNSYNSFFVRY